MTAMILSSKACHCKAITNGEYDILPYVDRSKYMVDAAKAHQTKAPLAVKKKQVKRKK